MTEKRLIKGKIEEAKFEKFEKIPVGWKHIKQMTQWK